MKNPLVKESYCRNFSCFLDGHVGHRRAVCVYHELLEQINLVYIVYMYIIHIIPIKDRYMKIVSVHLKIELCSLSLLMLVSLLFVSLAKDPSHLYCK